MSVPPREAHAPALAQAGYAPSSTSAKKALVTYCLSVSFFRLTMALLGSDEKHHRHMDTCSMSSRATDRHHLPEADTGVVSGLYHIANFFA
jgi:hypothetical protein